MRPKIKSIFVLSLMILGLYVAQFAQPANLEEIWNLPVEPFRIAGNVYYVGAKDLTSYLITTPKGHILIDSGMPETVPQIKKNIATLGFRLADVKIILNSHAHYDHVGGIAELRRLSGAAFYASKNDAGLLTRGGLDDPNYLDRFPFKPARPDKLLTDGQKVKLGGTTLTANITAGHTPGCTTWTTTIKENGKSLNAIFVCSVSSPGYDLVTNKKYPTIEADYRTSFAWLKKQRVDIFLGSHGFTFDLETKSAVIRKNRFPNPFIDPKRFETYVTESEKSFLEKLKTQKAEKK